MWKRKSLRLLKEQRERGIVFSSELYVCGHPELNHVTHEVSKDDPDRDIVIERLKDVTFFKRMARDEGWDVIEIVRQ